MRLIDADALSAKIETLMNRYAAQGRTEVAEDYNFVLTVLMTAETIDPESLRPKGEWTVIEDDYNEETIYQCSVCREEFVTIDETPAENLWNFCPNCGARMEG